MDAFDQALLDLEQAHDCALFPTELDFSKVCNCDDCRPKIETLKEFRKEIKANKRLVSEYGARCNNKEDLCMSICFGSLWTKQMLDFLRKKLRADSRVALKLEKSKLEVIDEQIVQRLREVGLLVGPKEELPDDNDDDDDILDRIDTGLVKKLPIDELQHQIEEIISEIFPREPRDMIIKKASECIFGACHTCIRKRKEFWQRSPLITEGNEHSGLKESLDSLIEKVNLFKEQWDKEFASVFCPRDRSDLKRQKVE